MRKIDIYHDNFGYNGIFMKLNKSLQFKSCIPLTEYSVCNSNVLAVVPN